MLTTIYHIARNTARESLRQPIYVILLLVTVSIIGAYPGVTLFVFRTQEKMVVDGSLATILLFGLICAVLCASYTVSREIDSGSVLLILSKPVSRPVFIISKIMGILGAITLFVWTSAVCTLIALKSATDQFRFDPYLMGGVFLMILFSCIFGGWRNYAAKKSFSESCSKALASSMSLLGVVAFFLPQWESFNYSWKDGSSYFNMNLCRELVLIMFAVWAMATLATALSTRFNLMSNLTICLVLFVLGLMSDWFKSNITKLTLSDLEQMMISWYYIFIPLIILIWIAAYKHFHHRKNELVGQWEIHTIFGLLSATVVGRAVVDAFNKAHLDEPAAWMKQVAGVLFSGKNLLAEILHAVIPNWQHFWLVDAIFGKKGASIPMAYIGTSAIYIGLFILMFTILAIQMFANREVGEQSSLN